MIWIETLEVLIVSQPNHHPKSSKQVTHQDVAGHGQSNPLAQAPCAGARASGRDTEVLFWMAMGCSKIAQTWPNQKQLKQNNSKQLHRQATPNSV